MAFKINNIVFVNSLLLLLACCVAASLTGIYVDNGEQTVLHHALSSDETHEVEHEILELLGLPDRPRKKHTHPSLR